MSESIVGIAERYERGRATSAAAASAEIITWD
jgi:hypothetical protein